MLIPGKGFEILSDENVANNAAVTPAAEDGIDEGGLAEAFNEWFEALPAQNEAFEWMFDDEILSHRVDDYL